MASYIKGGILAGFVIFLWSAFSWMILPWHMMTLHSFNHEEAVSNAIVSNVSQSGIYLIPLKYLEQQHQKKSDNNQLSHKKSHREASTSNTEAVSAKPFIFASVHLEGLSPAMGIPMLIGLITQIIAAIFVGWLLTRTTGLRYLGRVSFVMVFALAASIVTYGPYWNWLAFDTQYTLVCIADLLAGWLLAGLILAKFCKR